MRTKNCIFCGKPATQFCGHVEKDGEAVTAGVCGDCSKKAFAPGNLPLRPLPGFINPPIDQWRPEYGVDDNDRHAVRV